jgi:hypothetical protein
LRPADLEGVSSRAVSVEIEASLTASPPVTAAESRARSAVAGKRSVTNAAFKRAARDASIARDALVRARAAGLAEAEIARLSARADEAAKRAEGTPRKVDVDDRRDELSSVSVLRRHGEVKVKLRVGDAAAGERTLTVPFDLVQEEPDKHPLAADALEAAAARAVLDALGPVLAGLAAETRLGLPGRGAALVPGSPGWLLRTASRAAGDRAVRPLDVRLETHVESLAKGPLAIPITLPKSSDGRCLTFAGVSVDGVTNVDLAIEAAAPAERKHGVAIARDARAAVDAGVEVCGLDGSRAWTLAIGTRGAIPRGGVLVGIFASGPGDATPAASSAILDRPAVSAPSPITPLDATR